MDWVRLLLAVTKHECGGQFERFMLEKMGPDTKSVQDKQRQKTVLRRCNAPCYDIHLR